MQYPAERRFRTKPDDGDEPIDKRTLPGTGQGAAPRVTGDVSEPELLDRRKLPTSRMQRDDVIDRDGTARARRRLPVDRLPAELAAVVGSPPWPRQKPGDVLRPSRPMTPPRSTRNGAVQAELTGFGRSRGCLGTFGER